MKDFDTVYNEFIIEHPTWKMLDKDILLYFFIQGEKLQLDKKIEMLKQAQNSAEGME